MSTSNKEGDTPNFADKYQVKYDQVKPNPPLVKNIFWAFVVGGLICMLGQAIINYLQDIGLSLRDSVGLTSAIIIVLGAFLTGLGVYDELGKRAGAGSIVPVSGFANSIVAPAMEFKREGYVFGVGAKMFVIAGPVIVYGVLTAVIIGTVYWITH